MPTYVKPRDEFPEPAGASTTGVFTWFWSVWALPLTRRTCDACISGRSFKPASVGIGNRIWAQAYRATVISGNGTELTSMTVLELRYDTGVNCHFIEPGEFMQAGFVESFNVSFRHESLKETQFSSYADTKLLHYSDDDNRSSLYSSPSKFTHYELALEQHYKHILHVRYNKPISPALKWKRIEPLFRAYH